MRPGPTQPPAPGLKASIFTVPLLVTVPTPPGEWACVIRDVPAKCIDGGSRDERVDGRAVHGQDKAAELIWRTGAID